MTHIAVGKRIPRLDGVEKVTGRTQYVADLTLPGMVWGAVLRSPHAHARIRRVNTDRAARMPGVLAVITGRDVREGVLARERVRYQGEAVAAVAAHTREQAEAALRVVEVEYAALPAVMEVREAMRPGAVRIHEASEDPQLPNVCGVVEVKRGDVKAGFAAADRIFEETFETPWTHQGFIEPHASVASAEPGTGRITLWTATQAQFNQRAELAHVLGVPMSRLRVVGMPVGGAFGGKIALCVEAIAAELSRRAGRPVKVVVSRRDDFWATRPCGGSVLELKAGVKADGTLVALEARLLFDTGAYEGAQHSTGAVLLQGPYRVPNLAVKSYAIYTNRPPAGARRALTSPHVHFAIESLMDIMARDLGLDPLDIRLRNALRKGDPVMGGLEAPYSSVEKVLRAAAQAAGWAGRRGEGRRGRGPRVRGWGLAAGHWSIWAGMSSAWVQLNEDGTISVLTGAINLTGTDTSFAQIAAECFGVPVERVTVHQGDTDSSPRNDGTWGSRVLFGVGEAVRRAAEDAKRQLVQALSAELHAPPDRIEVAAGRVSIKGRRRSLSLAEAAQRAGPVAGRAALDDLPFGLAVAAQVAEVEVDRETGRVRVRRLVCAQDVGFAINPMSVEGQIEGAMSQGMGYALSEQYIYDGEGRLLNPDLMDFRLPIAPDHPEVAIRLLEERRDAGPFGAKGVGEPPLVPTAPAIANAVADAVGVRVRRLPITPERLHAELERGG